MVVSYRVETESKAKTNKLRSKAREKADCKSAFECYFRSKASDRGHIKIEPLKPHTTRDRLMAEEDTAQKFYF